MLDSPSQYPQSQGSVQMGALQCSVLWCSHLPILHQTRLRMLWITFKRLSYMEQFFEPLQQMLPSHQDLTARSMITHRTMTENPIRPLVCPNIIKGGKKASWGFCFVQDKLNLPPGKRNILAITFSKNPHHNFSLNYSKADCI